MTVESLIIKNKRICKVCRSITTYVRKDGYSDWRKYQNEDCCKKCYNKLVWNPKFTSEQYKKYNDKRTKEYIKKYNDIGNPLKVPRLFTFKNKRLLSKFKVRKGKCNWCGKKIGDKYIDHYGNLAVIKQTHIHHIEYYIIFPWFATIELCVSCHNKESWRLRRNVRTKLCPVS